MAMDITIEQNISTFQGFPHHHFRGAIFRALLHAWGNPLSVEVEAAQRRPVVADQYAIGVEHWNDLENKIVPQIFGHLVIGDKELQDSFDNERSITLTRVDSARDDDSTPNRYLLRPRPKVGDDGHLAIVSSDGLAHDGLPYAVLRFRRAQIL